MNGEIIIKSLECFGFHGVLEEEKKLGQKFVISAKLNLDVSKAVETDACENTVNYSEVCHMISDIVRDTNYNLIESLADRIAKEILIAFPLVDSIYVKVEKPWAPIKLGLDTVAVATEKKWHNVYLGVGSNLGDSQANIESAVKMMKASEYNKDVMISNLIKTKPYGYKEQDDFSAVRNVCAEYGHRESPYECLWLHLRRGGCSRRRTRQPCNLCQAVHYGELLSVCES